MSHFRGEPDEVLAPHEHSESIEDGDDEEHHVKGTVTDQDMSPWECIKAYPMAIFWCLTVSMCVVMEGYDTILIGNFFAYPSFQKKFGHYVPGVGYQLTPASQIGISQAAGVGAFFGTLANGYLVALFGQKRVLLYSLVLLSAVILITFSAQSLVVLGIGELLCGFPWGVFATTAPAYASEVLPLSLRVYFTSYTNMCFIMGQLVAAGALKSLAQRTDEWAFRIPFALQWVWPAFLFPLLLFAPESPWHLVRHGRLEEAKKSLNRLQLKSAQINVEETLGEIIHTNKLEEELAVGMSYWDCFKGFELRRTEIACMSFVGQILSGIGFAYNSTYFFEQIGLSTSENYLLNIGGTALGLFGTLISWFCFMPYFGRRTIYIAGMASMSAILIAIGILNLWTGDKSVARIQASLTLLWTFTFQLSVGQLGWAIPAEIGSTRLRQKTVCVARNAYCIAGVIGGTLQAYFMNPTAWNLRGYTGFVWGCTAFATTIWAYFRLPETKGRSYEELDLLFAENVPARKFKEYRFHDLEETEARLLSTRYSLTADRDNIEMEEVETSTQERGRLLTALES